MMTFVIFECPSKIGSKSCKISTVLTFLCIKYEKKETFENPKVTNKDFSTKSVPTWSNKANLNISVKILIKVVLNLNSIQSQFHTYWPKSFSGLFIKVFYWLYFLGQLWIKDYIKEKYNGSLYVITKTWHDHLQCEQQKPCLYFHAGKVIIYKSRGEQYYFRN